MKTVKVSASYRNKPYTRRKPITAVFPTVSQMRFREQFITVTSKAVGKKRSSESLDPAARIVQEDLSGKNFGAMERVVVDLTPSFNKTLYHVNLELLRLRSRAVKLSTP